MIDDQLRQEIIRFRRRFPFMGPRKIVARLRELRPDIAWPAASTIGDLLKCEGLVDRRRTQRKPVHPLRAIPKAAEPNHVMTIDFKGQFKLRIARTAIRSRSSMGSAATFLRAMR